jgi:hypothetical protein
MRMVRPLADTHDVLIPRPAGEAGAAQWRDGVRDRAETFLQAFVRDRCDEYVQGIPDADFVSGLLGSYVSGGKSARSSPTGASRRC